MDSHVACVVEMCTTPWTASEDCSINYPLSCKVLRVGASARPVKLCPSKPGTYPGFCGLETKSQYLRFLSGFDRNFYSARLISVYGNVDSRTNAGDQANYEY